MSLQHHLKPQPTPPILSKINDLPSPFKVQEPTPKIPGQIPSVHTSSAKSLNTQPHALSVCALSAPNTKTGLSWVALSSKPPTFGFSGELSGCDITNLIFYLQTPQHLKGPTDSLHLIPLWLGSVEPVLPQLHATKYALFERELQSGKTVAWHDNTPLDCKHWV